MTKKQILFFIDQVNSGFPGYYLIIRNLLKYIPNSKAVNDLKKIQSTDVVIPLGITAAHKLNREGIDFKICFLTDSPTLTFKSIIQFDLEKSIPIIPK